MITEHLSAWLLHKKPQGNTSFHCVFFTREYGLLECLFRGGRTPKKQAALQVFSPLWLAVNSRNHSFYLNQVEITGLPLRLSNMSLFAGLYINELLYYTLSIGESHPEFFNLYECTLKSIASSNERLVIEALLRRFEITLLNVCGYLFSFIEEADSGEPIIAARYYRWIGGKGFEQSEEGFMGEHLLTLAQGKFDDIQVLKTAKIVMRQAIAHLLKGRILKSRALFATLVD